MIALCKKSKISKKAVLNALFVQIAAIANSVAAIVSDVNSSESKRRG